MATQKPRALRPGDTISFVTPASPVAEAKLAACRELLENRGYVVRLMPHALDSDGYLAGLDETRAQDLTDAFADPSVAAIVCTRGGYGAARLFPYLDLDKLAAANKLFLGFSDVTSLHLALNQRGLPTVHAPMALTLSVPREPWVYESFFATLEGGEPIPGAAPAGQTVVGGLAEGEVTGGCLCLLTDSIGTPNSLQCQGKIVLIEDVDENPHRIDAMLTHLLNAGQIQRAAGIVIGDMTRTDERSDPSIGERPWREIVQERLGNLGIPLITDYPFGHVANMLSLPLGIRARLDADSARLYYLEALCG
jgi:muramoyltetrapeptide carboxypeptidase